MIDGAYWKAAERLNGLPINKAALKWLPDPELESLYLIQLAIWGVQNGLTLDQPWWGGITEDQLEERVYELWESDPDAALAAVVEIGDDEVILVAADLENAGSRDSAASLVLKAIQSGLVGP